MRICTACKRKNMIISSQKIKAAIIDDGVQSEVFHLDGNWIFDGDKIVCCNYSRIILADGSHANMCMRIIEKYADMDKTLWHSISVLEYDTKRGSIQRLLKALEFCDYLGIKLIHLSIGSTYYEDFDAIKVIVDRLVKKGVILVSATSNNDIVTYPAYLSNVIGVKCDPQLIGDTYIYNNDPIKKINFLASSRHQLNINGSFVDVPRANSYATPLITAKVIAHLTADPELNYENIIPHLISGALNSQDGVSCFKNKITYTDKNRMLLETPEIPIVVLSGFESEYLLQLIKHLSDRFKGDNYHCRVAVEHPLAERLEMTSAHLTIDLDYYAQKMNAYFCCDIILFGFSALIQPERCQCASLWIWSESAYNFARYEQYVFPENQVGIVVSNETGSEVYERIISLLL